MKIISGGQTGVDRAALDVSLKYGIDCGGWCPAGRLDELGRIPDRYPLTEVSSSTLTGASRPPLPSQGEARGRQPGGEGRKTIDLFAERTRANVRDAQATVAFYHVDLSGGTKYAIDCCIELERPYLLIDAAKTSIEQAVKAIVDLVQERKIDILGVGGPRASEWPAGYDYAFRVLDAVAQQL